MAVKGQIERAFPFSKLNMYCSLRGEEYMHLSVIVSLQVYGNYRFSHITYFVSCFLFHLKTICAVESVRCVDYLNV